MLLSGRPNLYVLIFFASILITLNFVLTEAWPVTGILGRLDNAVYTLGGAQWASGKIPYLAFWDNKPPSIYVLNAIAWKISGGFIGIWLFSLLACVATIVLFYRICRTLYGDEPALLASTYYFFLMLPEANPDIVNNFVLFLTLGSFEVAFVSGASMHYMIRCLILGFLWSVGLLLRPNAMLVDSVLCLLALIRSPNNQRVVSSAKGLFAMAIGAAAYIAPIIIYFIIHNAWYALQDCVERFNAVYVSGPIADHLKAIYSGIGVASGGNVIILAVTAVFILIRPYPHTRPEFILLERMLPIILITELLLASASGRPYGDYFILAMLVGGLIFCSFAASSFDMLKSVDPASMYLKKIMMASYGGIVLTGMLNFSFASEPVFVKGFWYDHPVSDVAAFLKSHPSDGKIFVWGDHPGVYLLPGVQRDVKYTFILPFSIKKYANPSTVLALLDNLKTVQPTYIFDLSAYGPNGSSLPPLNSVESVPAADPLHSIYVYIANAYEPCPGSVSGEFEVFKRRT